MSNHPTNGNGYTAEVSALDITLGVIRAQHGQGAITIREGADLRIAASEHHIEAVRVARRVLRR